jgi:hypothetical protein
VAEVNRYTFVIQVHPDGLSTLENLATHERIQVSDLAAVGPQIEQWLGSLPGSSRRRSDGQSGTDGRPAPGAAKTAP